jgi:hypothetical protein
MNNSIWRDFFQRNKLVADCQANRLILHKHIHDNHDIFSVEGLEDAAHALGDRLATSPPPILTPEEIEARRVRGIQRENERRRNMSPSQLRQIIRMENPPPQEPELPREYTGSVLRQLSSQELKALLRKYGAAQLNRRLEGR